MKMNPRLATVLAMVAFAGNSLLCRPALRDLSIDPFSFTSVRLISGALTLIVISRLTGQPAMRFQRRDVPTAMALVVYAVCFSLAYRLVSAGTGALVLFGSVQSTMITIAMIKKERLGPIRWTGFVVSVSGLCYLAWPGVSAPPLTGFFFMAAAGIAWGAYSILGKIASQPILQTTKNFLIASLPAVLLTVMLGTTSDFSWRAAFLAIASGSLASACGYVLWYRALSGLTISQAAIVQTSVPFLAALGGFIFMSEPISARLVGAGLLILGGVWIFFMTEGQKRTGTKLA